MLLEIPMMTMNTRHFFKSRKGLSVVVTSLIILVFSVLLAMMAINYTNGLTRARMKSSQQEDVRFHKVHAWVEPLVNGTDRSVVAFKLHNLGGKSIALQTIDVRGSEMDWTTVYFHQVNKTSENDLLYSDLNYFDWVSLVGDSVTIDGYAYNRSLGSVFVGSGETLVVYIKAPEIIFKSNIGQPAPIAIGTANANFITEMVIELAP